MLFPVHNLAVCIYACAWCVCVCVCVDVGVHVHGCMWGKYVKDASKNVHATKGEMVGMVPSQG